MRTHACTSARDFQTVSDCFGLFSECFGQLRIVSNCFRIVFKPFRIIINWFQFVLRLFLNRFFTNVYTHVRIKTGSALRLSRFGAPTASRSVSAKRHNFDVRWQGQALNVLQLYVRAYVRTVTCVRAFARTTYVRTCVTLRDVTLRYVTLRCVTLRYVTLR